MKSIITACLCLILAACAGARPRPDADYLAFIRLALHQIEGRDYSSIDRGKFTYVVPDSIDPRARAALASLRKVVAPAEVPASSKKPFSDYIEIRSFQIVGDSALAEGTIDPYEHNPLNCGQGFYYPFKYEHEVWVPLEAHWIMC